MKNVLLKYALVMAVCCPFHALEAQEISSFTLINSQEGLEIGPLSEGDSVNIAEIGTDELSIRADVTGDAGSVLFKLDGQIIGAQNSGPYALFGMTDSLYNPWTPELRTYKLEASIHSLPQGQGLLLDKNSISFTFYDENTMEPSGPNVNSLILINADTDEDIAEITDGSVFIIEEIGTSNLNIRAETDEGTESVVFGYQDSTNYHIENLPEYAIGANDGDDYRPWNPDIGLNKVSATAFDKNKGQGNSGEPLTVEFAVLEKSPYEKTSPFELRINSGGDTVVYNDTIYVADTLFLGDGKSFSNNKIVDILETDNDSIYQTERTTTGSLKSFGYSIPVENGAYEVKLHFAEIYWGATGGGDGGEGKRVFNVALEDKEVLADYDLAAEKGPMTAIVKTFTAIVSDGELNIDFGATVDQPKVSALEIYGKNSDVAPNECDWDQLASSPLNKTDIGSVKVNNKLYVLGSILSDSTRTHTMEVYDPETNVWSNVTPLPMELKGMGMIAVEDEIWLFGETETDSLGSVTNGVQVYSTMEDTWSDGPSLPEPRSAGAAVYHEERIHFFGGLKSDGVTEASDHFVLDLKDSLAVWQVVAPLPNPRSHLGAASADGKIYAIGGFQTLDNIAEPQIYFDEYDPLTDTWSRKADLPSAKSHLGSNVAIHDGKILLVGGRSSEATLETIDEYDLEADSWSNKCTLPSDFENPSAAIFGNQMLVVAGEGNQLVSMMLQPEVEIPEENGLNVLVYHETGGYRHKSIEAGIEMIREFGLELGWGVDASQTSDIFQIDSLDTFDVVVWMSTTGDDLLTLEEQEAFEGFIQNGGGFVGVHSATDTYRNGSWPWYNDLVGAIVQVNPYHTANNTNATIDIVGEHAAVEHLGMEWNKNEEYYYWERNGGYLFEGNIDLLQVRSTGPNTYDAARPVTWYKNYDGGRSFYTALGHNASDYQSNEEFRTMVKEAILWAGQEDEVVSEEPEEEPMPVPPVDETIEIFPNPVIDLLTVNTELLIEEVTGEIAIFGMDGILMKQKDLGLNDNQIDLSDLPVGYYVAAIRIGMVSERLLIYKQ